MNSLVRTTAAAAVLAILAAAPALADPPKLPMRAGEVVIPSALAAGEEYLSISKQLECEVIICTAVLKGRAKKQTLITNISCLVAIGTGHVSYGSVITGKNDSNIALAILPVMSRTVNGPGELAVVGGPTQVALGASDAVVLVVQSIGGAIGQAVCSLTGTTTKL